jgi:methyl-accepting chemotaxis protein
MLKQMKLSLKIWLGIGILISGYCLSMSLSYYNSHTAKKGLLSLAEFAGASSDLSQKAIVAFNNQLKNYEAAVLMGETELIEAGSMESKAVQENLNSLVNLPGVSDSTRQTIGQQLSEHEKYTQKGESVYNLLGNGSSDSALFADAKALSEQQELLKNSISEVSTMVRDDLLVNINGVVSDSTQHDRINLILFFCVVSASVLIVFFLIRLSILAPLYRLLAGLDDSSKEVSVISSQLSSTSNQLSDGASRQAASIEEASSSLEEMSSMTRQNADSAGQANNLMKDANQVVEKADTSMTELTISMQEISKASEETSNIIKTIDEIAFQTNLLALNAAVEAARAGDAGAGFAVVADEVRNLAIRAANAAKSTSDLIESTTKKIKDGGSLVERTSDAFSQVAQSASRVGELIGEIAAASNEQAGGIEQVSKALAEMSMVVQKNVANAEENTSTSEGMSSMAVQMNFFVSELVRLVDGGRKGSNGRQEKIGYTPAKKNQGVPDRSVKKLYAAQAALPKETKKGRLGREITPMEVLSINMN